MSIRLLLALIVALTAIGIGIAYGRITTLLLGAVLGVWVLTGVLRKDRGPQMPSPPMGRDPASIQGTEAPIKSEPAPAPPRSWVIESLHYFRALGFFAADEALSDEELAGRLQKNNAEEWGMPVAPPDSQADLMLLRLDAERVWWEDTEADVCEGNGVYVDTLRAWGRISRGAFSPTDIDERWNSGRGPIRVSFKHRNRTEELHPDYCDDYLDMTLLDDINRMIHPAGYVFSTYFPFDQTAFVVVLTENEKKRLERERKWEFTS